MRTHARPRLLRLIALFKLVKAIALLASLAVLFKLVNANDPMRTVAGWALILHVDPDNRYLAAGLAAVLGLNAHRFALVAAGTLLYAGLFAIEGVGLWLAKTWAEYLTIVATAGFIPVEVYEVVTRATVSRALLLVVNGAIVAYLLVQVRAQHPSE